MQRIQKPRNHSSQKSLNLLSNLLSNIRRYIERLQRFTDWKGISNAIVEKFLAAGLHSSAYKIANCFSTLISSQCRQGHFEIRAGFRCKQRFCPRCNYLKSAKVSRETVSAVESLQQEYPELCLYFVTFTLPTRLVEETVDTLDRLNKAFTRMLRRSKLADFLLGTLRGIHIKCDPVTELVGIHIHALFAFKPSFHNQNHLSEAQWRELWQESFQDQSITQVDVTPVQPYFKHATLAEAAGSVAGYAANFIDLFESPGLYEMPLAFIRTLYSALDGRKLHFFTGKLNKARPEKQAVPHPDHICRICSSAAEESMHRWDHQTQTYVKREQAVVSLSDGSVVDSQVETKPIVIGYSTATWPDSKNSGARQGKSSFSSSPISRGG